MLGLSVNAALGHAGLLVLLTASVVGALSTGYAIVTHNRTALRQSLAYAWLILIGALLAVFAMQRALHVRDYSLASAVSFVLMVIITLGVFAYARALGTEELA